MIVERREDLIELDLVAFLHFERGDDATTHGRAGHSHHAEAGLEATQAGDPTLIGLCMTDDAESLGGEREEESESKPGSRNDEDGDRGCLLCNPHGFDYTGLALRISKRFGRVAVSAEGSRPPGDGVEFPRADGAAPE